jgi:hypothetical protein
MVKPPESGWPVIQHRGRSLIRWDADRCNHTVERDQGQARGLVRPML